MEKSRQFQTLPIEGLANFPLAPSWPTEGREGNRRRLLTDTCGQEPRGHRLPTTGLAEKRNPNATFMGKNEAGINHAGFASNWRPA